MAGPTVATDDESGTPDRRSFRAALWQLTAVTVGACFRHRVTGLAAEAAFFAILSLPPLIFGLAGTIGYLVVWLDVQTVNNVQQQVVSLAEQALTTESVQQVLMPTLESVLDERRFEVVSVGFVLALWSGSRALNVFIDTVTIMYGLGGRRGIVKTRALSFTLYVIALVVGIVVLPLVLAGPRIVGSLLPDGLERLVGLYWPTVLLLSVFFITTLYHLSVPVRAPWRYNLPGAAFALTTWIGGSYLLRWTLSVAVGGTSIYGPLAAPIAVLLWLYLIAIAVLVGAALNAAVDRVWPARETDQARRELRWLGLRRAPGPDRSGAEAYDGAGPSVRRGEPAGR